ncbi:unnamed protein product [[Actinomadura] parvosata subsp. kistnae]|uniref:Uncharacterized protein n=1 Tax=[Actinomadura] parvosata subsp. kistnae TaxID=1909395 RepID=A0A1V0ABV5_9ACTN|nr:hypothetical protein [Nonomuraea sp. ATCC 55076]AQZ67622.1 hypothetical protein BKM31_44690 [Nonomuraea sp. ATCC 55076]SPL94094.1 unnamed protein product [Actinomadura parvosata subsp. kistnae]
MSTVTTMPPRGEIFDFADTARKLTREYVDGYQAGIAWLESGAPVSEVDAIADFYERTRPGQSAEESTHYLDAEQFLSLLASMHAQGHTQGFTIENGSEVRAEYVRDYGQQFAAWELPDRVFVLTALDSFDDGLATAVWQARRG